MMAECNKCGETCLEWSKKSGRWKLYSGRKEHVCGTPSMGFLKQKEIDKRKQESIIGFCFNNRNLEEGLLERIKRGDYAN